MNATAKRDLKVHLPNFLIDEEEAEFHGNNRFTQLVNFSYWLVLELEWTLGLLSSWFRVLSVKRINY